MSVFHFFVALLFALLFSPHFFLPPFFFHSPIFLPSLLPFRLFHFTLLTFYFPPLPLFLPLYFLDPLCSSFVPPLYYLCYNYNPLLSPLVVFFSFLFFFQGCDRILSRKHNNKIKKTTEHNDSTDWSYVSEVFKNCKCKPFT